MIATGGPVSRAAGTRRAVVFCVLAWAACGGETAPQQQVSAEAPRTEADQQAADSVIDACSLLTQAEVEAVVGRSVLAPQKEDVANLSTCSFGDPSAPLVGGRSISQIASMSVFAGTSEYYAGPVAQAREAFETGRNNAASVEPVSGLGDDAYWDGTLRTLNVLEARFELEVTIASDAGGLDQARAIALKALSKLPS